MAVMMLIKIRNEVTKYEKCIFWEEKKTIKEKKNRFGIFFGKLDGKYLKEGISTYFLWESI